MVDLLSDLLHIGCRIKLKYQNAYNSKHQIALDLKFSINTGNLIKYRKRGYKGSLRHERRSVVSLNIYRALKSPAISRYTIYIYPCVDSG